jgi:hypothetical protein
VNTRAENKKAHEGAKKKRNPGKDVLFFWELLRNLYHKKRRGGNRRKFYCYQKNPLPNKYIVNIIYIEVVEVERLPLYPSWPALLVARVFFLSASMNGNALYIFVHNRARDDTPCGTEDGTVL